MSAALPESKFELDQMLGPCQGATGVAKPLNNSLWKISGILIQVLDPRGFTQDRAVQSHTYIAMTGGLLVPFVVTALLAAITANAQTITFSSPTQTSNGQFINVTVTGERRTKDIKAQSTNLREAPCAA
jgi:hypothetical protein